MWQWLIAAAHGVSSFEHWLKPVPVVFPTYFWAAQESQLAMSSNGRSPRSSALALYELEQPRQVARGMAPLVDDLGCSGHEDPPVGLDEIRGAVESR